MERLHGIIPPMVTPMTGDGKIDAEGTGRLVEHILAGRVHGLFILGTTGEAQSLSVQARKTFVELVCNIVKGRVPVLVGISDTSIDDSLSLAETAVKCGASAAVAAAPYYFPVSQEELKDYFSALADRLPLPLYLYNMPSHVKVSIAPETVKALGFHKNIKGLKDSSANMTYFQTLLHLMRDNDDFSLYMGPEEITGESILAGAAGGINGGANMFPELYVSMYDAASAGDIARMRELQERIMQVSSSVYNVVQSSSGYLCGLKCALSLMGICNDFVALPYRRFDEDRRADVRRALETLGVKCVK